MKKATTLTHIAFLLFFISIISGISNYFITGTSTVTNLTLLPLISILSFLFFMIILGLDILISNFKNGIESPQFINTLCVAVCSIAFLTIFINGPILGNDLNSSFSITLGALFLTGVTVALFNGIFRM